MQALRNNIVLARSDDTLSVQGHCPFSQRSLKRESIALSHHMTSCAWKRQASYYSGRLDGKLKSDAAWCDADSKFKAAPVRGLVLYVSMAKVP